MNRSVSLCLAALLIVAGCTNKPDGKETASVEAPNDALSAEEREQIAGLQVYQRDLDALGNLYQNVESSAVREAVLDMRAIEIIRLLGEADSRRDVYEIEQQMIPNEAASAKNALLDRKAALR